MICPSVVVCLLCVCVFFFVFDLFFRFIFVFVFAFVILFFAFFRVRFRPSLVVYFPVVCRFRFFVLCRYRPFCFCFPLRFRSFFFRSPFPFLPAFLFVLVFVLILFCFSSTTSLGAKVVEHTREGVSQLQRAEEHQQSALPIKCIAILVFLIILMLGLLVWKHSD